MKNSLLSCMNCFINNLAYSINKFILRGQNRSVIAKKNILASIFIKGGGIIISLLLIPLTINYVDTERYGIWLTISSIVAWFSFFDIGLTQGLRNKFAEAITKGEIEKAQVYVSTTYALLSIIFIGIWLIFIVMNRFINWASIMNISAEMSSESSMLAMIVFTYFCFSFILRIITSILTADQKPALSSLTDLGGQFLSLLTVFILVKTTEGSLVYLGLSLCGAPLAVLLLCSFLLFRKKYSRYRPDFKKIDFSYSRELFSLGFVFFIIQLANIIQFQTANIIIARSYSLNDVTSYNIVYRYFGLLNMTFTIFLTPFWSASTEAFLKNDIEWIKGWIKRYNQLGLLLIFGGILMLIFSGFFYRIWLGEGTVDIDFSLSAFGFLFFCTSIFGGKYVSFLNGISALRMQFIACLASPFIFFAVAYVLIKQCGLGVSSLFIASIVANFNTFILAPFQYNRIIIKGNKGIWLK